MTYGSLFSGVGGFDLAFDNAGLEGLWQCELDADCRNVLAKHWPSARRIDNVVRLRAMIEHEKTHAVRRLARPDVLCGGFPCQDLSVAGRRAGLAGARSGMWFVFRRIIAKLRPRVVVIENVPGLLSSNGGRDFGTVLRGLAGMGYGFAYRILDAQWFGVPQRRRRVFVVGRLGDWRRAAEILFESDGLPWDSPPSREARTRVAGAVTGRIDRGGVNSEGNDGHLITGTFTGSGDSGSGFRNADGPVAGTCVARAGRNGNAGQKPEMLIAHSLTAGGHDASEDGTGRGTPIVPVLARSVTTREGLRLGDLQDTLIPIAFDERQLTSPHNRSNPRPDAPCHTLHERPPSIAYQCHGSNVGPMGTLRSGNGNEAGGVPFTLHGSDDCARVASETDISQSLRTRAPGSIENSSTTAVLNRAGVRRLMPIECERLMGLPDDWTRYGADDKEMSDSTRYRMCGNAVERNTAEWIGRRIKAQFDNDQRGKADA